MKTVLLSIKPEFAEKIFDGTKKFEFRKTIFKNNNVQKVIVYASSPVQKVIGEFSIEDILNDDVLGILTIEKIGLKAIVKEGSTKDILVDYIGHISETSKYDGNIGLAAHNRLNNYSYFARINELGQGDIITYKTKFGTKDYKVNNLKVIYETDWKPLEEDGTNKLTLITCIADKRNQRLCVQAIAD